MARLLHGGSELQDIPLLEFTKEATELARRFLGNGMIPAKSVQDAFHVAVAAVHGMDYLLTWNCRHIAATLTKPRSWAGPWAPPPSLAMICRYFARPNN